ncbi:MBL fold metallo-hydrolase [Cereibacter sphaeroides]|uniref:MBL fold metallo-hydrolase n=1 Tax=Cereibacter sphaeroides TaxID=1063 RepID=UPI001F48AF6C|nr:MBL fold metallo-hydrolase [Cereibacter sphaeroides]MCE6959416.1 MBL fold metallo-hydrolase [Cereibacter sphaeroides]MCE6968311.1 MBL fold metallo-hydrolase [Cereibacter sphaeroides]MCE6973813.1 MBL fold metallo-hydrolase [Cereibacter sphaeroides]
MARLRCTILGCGSSGGVPRLGGHWGDCDPANPKNRRRRCSMLIERIEDGGTTRVLIDTSPDLHPQLLDAGVGVLDAVAWTHAHADHVHGIDDLRQIVFNMQKRLPVWADPVTQDSLLTRFGYAFTQPAGSLYPPILDLNTIDGPFEITGAGGTIRLQPFEVSHGPTDALGFRVGGMAYLPDVVSIPEESWPHLDGLKMWVLDTLRRRPHPTHVHLERALEWIDRARPERAILTNMHIDLDYETLAAELPAHVVPAYDGLSFDLDA